MKTANFHSLIKLACAALLLLGSLSGYAQNTQVLGTLPRKSETVRTMSVGLGYKGALDTYLSAAAYSGMALQLSDQSTKAISNNKRFDFIDTHSSASLSSMTNALGTGSMIACEFDEIQTWCHPFLRTQAVDIIVGPSAVSSVGVLYDRRNSNNPAQFKFLMSAAASGKAIYRFNLLKRYMALTANVSFPILGITFAPNYLEPYFYMAKHTDILDSFHAATPINAPAVYSDLTWTIPFRKDNRITFTYEANYKGYTIEGQKSAIANHAFLVGFTNRFELKKD